MAKMEALKLSKSQLALNCKMSLRTITKRLDGIEPFETDGKVARYHLWDVGRALFNPGAGATGTQEDLTAQKTRESLARTKLLERKDAIESGDIIPGPDVDDLISELAGAIGGGFRAFPAQLANRCVGMTAPQIKEIASEMVSDILSTLKEEAEARAK